MLARWGLIPGWTKDPNDLPAHFNARSETATEKASFKAAMRHRRVLVPASGFYEWRRVGDRRSQAYWVRPRQGGIVAFGGLMETYAEPGGSEIDTAAILTTGASAGHRPHPRPHAGSDQAGGFPRHGSIAAVRSRATSQHLMRPPEEGFFEAIPVSDKVNKVANTGPDLQEREEMVPPTKAAEARKPKQAGQLTLF